MSYLNQHTSKAINFELKPDSSGHSTAADPSSAAILIPDAHLLFSARFTRSNDDLLLSADGATLVVSDYFKSGRLQSLMSPEGATLSGGTVALMAGSETPGQFAQAGPQVGTSQAIGRVEKVSGNATVVRNGVQIALTIGDSVLKGDVVQTAANSSLGISFLDGTAFSLSASARMVLNDMVYDPDGTSNSALLSLVQGGISFVAGKVAKTGDMKVETPVATMGIRGTAVLVEISASFGPSKFSVLVEPDGTVGSFQLFDKNNPSVVLATVSTAGSNTVITPAGPVDVLVQQIGKTPAELQAELAIVRDVFDVFRLGQLSPFNPTGPGVGGSPPAPGQAPGDGLDLTPPDINVPRLASDVTVVTIPFAQASFGGGEGEEGTVTVTFATNSPPSVLVSNLVANAASDLTGFLIANQVTITDPDAGDALLLYVPGTASLQSVVGPAFVPPGVTLSSLITIDPATGSVSYDASNFAFLGGTEAVVYTIAFESRSGPDSVDATVTLTVNGVNDTPVIVAQAASDVTNFNIASRVTVADPDVSDVALPYVPGSASLQSVSGPAFVPPGVTLSSLISIDPATGSVSYDASDFAFLGATDAVVYTIAFASRSGPDTVGTTVTVTVNGVNDAPVITSASQQAAIIDTDADVSGGAGGGGGSAAPLTPLAASYLAGGSDLVGSLGGTSGFGEQLLARNDDGSTGAIDITSVFGAAGLDFFGTRYTSLFINNNGNITFAAPTGTFTPSAITGGANNPIIAPFWADVDTRGGTVAPTPGGNSTGTNLVYYDLDAVNRVLTVTWDDVGYYSIGTDRLNAFQLQLIDRGNGDFDIVFRYEDINWTTGGASGGSGGLGGTPARAGYSAGDGVNAFELPQSGNQAAILALDDTAGNTGHPGVTVFQVRNGVVGAPQLATSGTITFDDLDLSDSHTATSVYTGIEPALGSLLLAPAADTTGSGTGGAFTWTYSVDPALVDALGASVTKTETFDVTVSDGKGGTSVQTITINFTGSNDVPRVGLCAGPNLIVNGSFETPEVPGEGGWVPANPLPGWTNVSALGTVPEPHEEPYRSATPYGDQWLDSQATTGGIDVSQAVAGAVADTHYVLSVSLSRGGAEDTPGVDDSILKVWWGGALIATITENDLPADNSFRIFSFSVVGGANAASNTLRFQDVGISDTQGLAIDNVTLYTDCDRQAGHVIENAILSATDAFAVKDIDLNDTLDIAASLVGEPVYDGAVPADPAALKAILAAGFSVLPPSLGNEGQVTWTYNLPNSAVQFLGAGDTITLTFNVTVTDDANAQAAEPVTIAIVGTEAGQQVVGTSGDDGLAGGGGNDVIAGLGGNDVLTGGAGNDTFVFGPDFGRATVTDFTTGPGAQDVIALDNLDVATFGALQALMADTGADTVITFASGGVLTLHSVDLASLSQDDFRFLTT